MGNCICSKVDESPSSLRSRKYTELRNSHRGSIPSVVSSRSSTIQRAATIVKPAGDLLQTAAESLSYGFFPHVDAETLCALALAASSGIETLEVWFDDIAEMRLGVCQVTLSAAERLASQHGMVAFGVPTKQTLLSPLPNLYYAAALLQQLLSFGDAQRSVRFCVKAYYAGAKAVIAEEEEEYPASMYTDHVSETDPQGRTMLLWHNFKVARRHLARLVVLEAQAEAEMSPMHVVQKDETLSSIARVCQITVQELRKVNPDIPTTLQCGDCIALPTPCQPRLYCTRKGDSWASISSVLHTPPAKLRLHNADALVRLYTWQTPLVVITLTVFRTGSSILASLTCSSTLLEGQLIEAPGMGNGSSEFSHCSDESRMEEYNADFYLNTQQVFGSGHVGQFEPLSEVQSTSKEIVGAMTD